MHALPTSADVPRDVGFWRFYDGESDRHGFMCRVSHTLAAMLGILS